MNIRYAYVCSDQEQCFCCVGYNLKFERAESNVHEINQTIIIASVFSSITCPDMGVGEPASIRGVEAGNNPHG